MTEEHDLKCNCGVLVGITRPEQTEYRVFWKDNGQDIESKAYYTDLVHDAVRTMFYQARRYGANISGDDFTQKCIRYVGGIFSGEEIKIIPPGGTR